MKTSKHEDNSKAMDIEEVINSSKAWVLINIDRDGFHYRSSQDEEALILLAHALSARNEDWELVKEYVDSIKIGEQEMLN